MQRGKQYKKSDHYFLQGGGEMGRLIRNYDWSSTPVGSPEHWPQSLRTVIAMILASRFPMFLWWGEDLIQFYNDAYLPSFGREGKHPRALGQKAKDCWPEIWDIIYPLIQQVKLTGEATWSEDQLVPIYRNGRIEDVYWTFGYSPVITESEKIEGVLVVCMETTGKVQHLKEQALAKQQLEESEKNFRNTILKAPVAMCIFRGSQYVVEIANDRMIELWGKSPGAILSRPIFEGLPEARDQGFEQLLENVFTTGEAFSAQNVPVTLPRNGKIEIVYVDFLYEAFREPDGIISGIIAVAVDVTGQVIARRKVEEVVAERTAALNEANNNLQRSNAELAEFAYIASHDLQEPIRKVSTFTQMLEGSLGNTINDLSKTYLSRINNSTERMLALIRGVLAYSEISKDNRVFARVDLQQVIEGIKTDFELLMEQTNGQIHYAGLPVIEANPLQMAQLFGNLISNALKFARKDKPPVIMITTSVLPKEEAAGYSLYENGRSYYRIEVKDNGIGFNQVHAEQIFSIFQRLHGKKDYPGTGIGLAMCKKIVQHHRGHIFATANPASGALFTVILPVQQSS